MKGMAGGCSGAEGAGEGEVKGGGLGTTTAACGQFVHCANCHRLLSFSFSLRCVCLGVCVCTRFSQCPFNFTVSWLLKRQLARKGKQRRQREGEGESWRCLPQAVCKILINSIIKRIHTQQHAHTPANKHTRSHT